MYFPEAMVILQLLLYTSVDDNNDLVSDGGDAQHGGGLRHTEDGDAHQSHLWWDLT